MGKILRGDILITNLEPIKGSEQGGIRPVLIVQNNVFNKYSPTTIIAPLTSKHLSKKYLTSIFVSKKDSGLDKDSTILLNQIRTIDKSRLIKKVGFLNNYLMGKVNKALKVSLDIS